MVLRGTLLQTTTAAAAAPAAQATRTPAAPPRTRRRRRHRPHHRREHPWHRGHSATCASTASARTPSACHRRTRRRCRCQDMASAAGLFALPRSASRSRLVHRFCHMERSDDSRCVPMMPSSGCRSSGPGSAATEAKHSAICAVESGRGPRAARARRRRESARRVRASWRDTVASCSFTRARSRRASAPARSNTRAAGDPAPRAGRPRGQRLAHQREVTRPVRIGGSPSSAARPAGPTRSASCILDRQRLEPPLRAQAIDVALRQHRAQPGREAAAPLEVAEAATGARPAASLMP